MGVLNMSIYILGYIEDMPRIALHLEFFIILLRYFISDFHFISFIMEFPLNFCGIISSLVRFFG